jgi:integrase
MLFAAYTGLRSQELRKLRVKDFDFRNEIPGVHVGGTVDTSTKTRNYRTVGLHQRILPLTYRLLDGRSPDYRPFGEFFYDIYKVSREFRHIRTAIMLQDPTITFMHKFKSLRDSFGTWHDAAGSTMIQLAQMMGHSSWKMTRKYVHNTMGVASMAATNF